MRGLSTASHDNDETGLYDDVELRQVWDGTGKAEHEASATLKGK